MLEKKKEYEIFYDFEENFFITNDYCKNDGALFLDRDGVIIRDVNYIKDPNDVQIEKGLIELLIKAHEFKWPVFVITNQSGISRGYYSWDEFYKVNERMIELIGKPNPIYSIYANSHISSNCNNWRKPNPFMIKHAAERFNINLSKSILIGDRLSDMLAGLKSGINTLIHVETGHGIGEKSQISKYINKDGFFSCSGLSSKVIFLENLTFFPYQCLLKK